MATYEVDVGKNTYEVDAPDEKTAWKMANNFHQKRLSEVNTPRHMVDVAGNAPFKGAAGAIDALLNTPTNIANLGIAGYGAAQAALGHPERAPDVLQQPDYARRALTAIGLINPDVKPMSPMERIVDVAGQTAAGSAIMPGSTLANVGRNAVAGGLTGVVGQGVTEATGNPVAGQIAGLLTPAAIGKASQIAAGKVANLEAQGAANEERTANTVRGMEQGYVLPPSINRPNMISRALESLGGKAATGQEAQLRNQEVTNSLVRKELGLAENQPITEDALNKLRTKYSQPYRDVSNLPSLTEFNPYLTRSNTLNPKQMVEDLKTARANANDWYKAYARDQQPQTLAQAKAYKNEATQLETDLEKVASQAGKPELVDQLRQARQQIAKTYTAENALNLGSTNIDARALGRALDKGAPLSGNLKDIALFAEANPAFVREASGVTTPGVSMLDAYGSAAGMATGHPITGGLPLLRGPARALLLSKPYQNLFAKPDYSASALAKMLSKYNPSDADIKAMQAALLLSRSEAQ
jgi:hypothetical protein